MCDSGKYDSMRESLFSGTRFRPAAMLQAKLPKLCITPLGMPVVPEVYMIVHSSSAGAHRVAGHRLRSWRRCRPRSESRSGGDSG